MATTKKGNELAAKLAPALGYTYDISETCAKICRAAATLQRLAEEECNGPSWLEYSDVQLGRMYRENGPTDEFRKAQERHSKRMEKWQTSLEAKQERTEKRFINLVDQLPHTDQGPLKASPVGDPRGCSLILVPDGCGIRKDDWNSTGVCVP